MKNLLALIGFLVLSCTLGYAQRINTSKAPSLFTEITPLSPQLRAMTTTTSTVNMIDSLRVKPWVDSVRIAHINMDFRALLTQRELTLNFFGGDTFIAQRKKIQPLAENLFSWHGDIPQYRASITLIVRPQSLRGELHLADHIFHIETMPDKSILLYRVNTMKLPPVAAD